MELSNAREHLDRSSLPSPDDGWTWPPGGPLPVPGASRWRTEEWAPATTVRRPLLRLGRRTLLYRRRGS